MNLKLDSQYYLSSKQIISRDKRLSGKERFYPIARSAQHSSWTARRLHRFLFGQCLINFFGSCWTPEASLSEPRQKSTASQNNDQNNLQLTFKRLAQAYNAATEDHSQSSSANSNPATPHTHTRVFRPLSIVKRGDIVLFVFSTFLGFQ